MIKETMLFQDRAEAGRQLATQLIRYQEENPIVLALPRGGVVVGYEIARALQAPLDVLVARKLGAPGHQELGIGAIAPGGVRVLDEAAVEWLAISPTQRERIVALETMEMERRLRLYRGDCPLPDVRDRTVILGDDGLATGVTARAAILSIRQQHPRHLVPAVPVCSPQAAEALSGEVDDLVCLFRPIFFRAVGLWYDDFRQVSDNEVIALLERTRSEDAPDKEDAECTHRHGTLLW